MKVIVEYRMTGYLCFASTAPMQDHRSKVIGDNLSEFYAEYDGELRLTETTA